MNENDEPDNRSFIVSAVRNNFNVDLSLLDGDAALRSSSRSISHAANSSLIMIIPAIALFPHVVLHAPIGVEMRQIKQCSEERW